MGLEDREMRALPALLLFGLAWLATQAFAAPAPKVDVCHVPPGNPANFHTISVSGNALPAHLAHGDFLGPCLGANQIFVSEEVGGTLTLTDIPEFSLFVEPGSATFADGSKSGVISATVLPTPTDSPRFVVTIQPAGVVFDPPAPVVLPNALRLAPGDMVEMFFFNHDLGTFVNIGPGTVSEDGSVVVSDPGFGIVQSG